MSEELKEKQIFKITGFRESWAKIKDLVAKNWEEVDDRADKLDLKVVEKFYEDLEDLDQHFVVVAYCGEKVIGYSSMFVMNNPHTGTLHGSSDVLYVDPDYRGDELGVDLIALSEIKAVSMGAEYLSFTFKSNAPHKGLTERLGFTQSEVVYNKVIGKR